AGRVIEQRSRMCAKRTAARPSSAVDAFHHLELSAECCQQREHRSQFRAGRTGLCAGYSGLPEARELAGFRLVQAALEPQSLKSMPELPRASDGDRQFAHAE